MIRGVERPGRNQMRVVVFLATLMLLGALARGASFLTTRATGATSLEPALGRTAALANGSDWLRIRYNLSQSGDRISAWPRIALGKEGSNDRYVAVVWSEGSASVGAGHLGHVYLRWVDEETGAWSNKVTIDNVGLLPDENNWAAEPALAMDGTTARVVWVQRSSGNYSLRYRTCSLETGDRGTVEVVVQTGSASSDNIGRPDIALGSDGQPHVVWQQGADEGQRAYYRYRASGGTWQDDFAGNPLSEGDVDRKNDHPSLAANSDGSVVAVWSVNYSYDAQEKDRTDYISSHRKAGGSWDFLPNRLFSEDNSYPDDLRAISANPVVASNGSTLYAVWDKHLYSETSSKQEFRLYSKKSTDSGVTWQPSHREHRTWLPSNGVEYESMTSESPESGYYPDNLQPAAFVDDDGDLHIVWHRYLKEWEGETPVYDQYDVMYWSTDLSKVAGVSSTEPITVATLSAGGSVLGSNNVAADVAVGRWNGEWHLHVVVMLSSGTNWDVYYLSNERYSSVYLPIVLKNH